MRKETVEKPWGKFERFTLNEVSTVKLISIKKGEALSLQTHEHRSEFLKIVTGTPNVQIGESVVEAKPGDEFTIHEKEQHRVSAPNNDVEILEISLGDFDENDITRLEDNYGRV